MREKDGLWAVLCWLNILAVREVSVDELVTSHWRKFGRHFYARHDYEGLDLTAANDLMDALRGALPSLATRSIAGLTPTLCDDFTYVDPVDHDVAARQGVRIVFGDAARIVYRLSGTGTEGATLRVYLERFESDVSRHGVPVQDALADLAAAAVDIAGIKARTNRDAPSLIT
jgi:phosphoglucomutase